MSFERTIMSSIFHVLLFATKLISGEGDEEEIRPYQPKTSEDPYTYTGIPFGVHATLFSIGLMIGLLPYLFWTKLMRFQKFWKNGGLYLNAAVSNTEQARRLKVYKLDEIETATDYFDLQRRIGDGRSQRTEMYRALLTNKNHLAAVKRNLKVHKELRLRFLEDATILFNITHPNIVSLHGVCLESEQPMLIYQLIESSENLYSFIENFTDRSWQQVLRILKRIANAVSYLHVLNLCHKNLKLNNILIQEKKKVYVADLGLTNFQEQQRVYTKYQDVYDFGILMAHILTGICDTNDLSVKSFMTSVNEGSEEEVFDLRLEPLQDKTKLWNAALLACACLRQHGENRPSMAHVANVLSSRHDIDDYYRMVMEYKDPDVACSVGSSPRSSSSRPYRRSLSHPSNEEEAAFMRRDAV